MKYLQVHLEFVTEVTKTVMINITKLIMKYAIAFLETGLHESHPF